MTRVTRVDQNHPAIVELLDACGSFVANPDVDLTVVLNELNAAGRPGWLRRIATDRRSHRELIRGGADDPRARFAVYTSCVKHIAVRELDAPVQQLTYASSCPSDTDATDLAVFGCRSAHTNRHIYPCVQIRVPPGPPTPLDLHAMLVVVRRPDDYVLRATAEIVVPASGEGALDQGSLEVAVDAVLESTRFHDGAVRIMKPAAVKRLVDELVTPCGPLAGIASAMVMNRAKIAILRQRAQVLEERPSPTAQETGRRLRRKAEILEGAEPLR